MPSPASSAESPPATTFSSSRPRVAWSSVAAMRAAAVGLVSAVRSATSSFSLRVTGATLPATTQGSRQPLPVGIRMPS